MGKFIKRFTNHNNYSNLIFDYTNTPNISKCILENEIHYQKKLYPHYNLFDILYVDSNGKKKVDSNILDPNLGYTPIGLCVVETNFFGDNEPARFISLKYMNYETPDSGSLLSQGMMWGNYGPDIITINNINYVYGDISDTCYLTDNNPSNGSPTVPSVFDNGKWNLSILGEVNSIMLTDIDGKNKTNKIIEVATEQSTWQTDTTIINLSNANYYPAACCCWRYHTLGTQQGDWYLPAGGELVFLSIYYEIINNKLLQISNVYNNDCISSLINHTYWSSSEKSGNYAYTIGLVKGYIEFRKKQYDFDTMAMLQY